MNDVIVTKELFYKLYKELWPYIKTTTENEFKKFEQIKFEVKYEDVDMDKMEVCNYNLWDKNKEKSDGSSIHYLRLYVKIYYNRAYGDIFYDFNENKWGVKGELPFTLPEDYGDFVMQQIADKKKISAEDCYKASSYRR